MKTVIGTRGGTEKDEGDRMATIITFFYALLAVLFFIVGIASKMLEAIFGGMIQTIRDALKFIAGSAGILIALFMLNSVLALAAGNSDPTTGDVSTIALCLLISCGVIRLLSELLFMIFKKIQALCQKIMKFCDGRFAAFVNGIIRQLEKG